MSEASKQVLTEAEIQNPPTVFVVDDDEQVRCSIEQLSRSVDLNVEVFDSAESFLQTTITDRAGCVVTDVRMPGMSGLQLQEKLNEGGVTLPMIVITGFAEVPMAVQALKNGAFDFIQKPFPPHALIEVMKRAISANEQQRREDLLRREVQEKLATLSSRESEVLEHLVTGRSTKKIASALAISLTTVDFHRNNILKKMRLENVVELTRAVTMVSQPSLG